MLSDDEEAEAGPSGSAEEDDASSSGESTSRAGDTHVLEGLGGIIEEEGEWSD